MSQSVVSRIRGFILDIRNWFQPEIEDPGKIYISGTGRAGTTALVQLLTELGCDTGFSLEEVRTPTPHPNPKKRTYFEKARAGFERDIFEKDGPKIIKSPFLCGKIDEVLQSGIQISHIIIPVRDFGAAAESRALVQSETTGQRDGKSVAGGLWATQLSSDQESVLKSMLAELVEACVRNEIAMTFLSFPRFANDPDYLFDRIRFLLPRDVDRKKFQSAFAATIRRDLIHDFQRK